MTSDAAAGRTTAPVVDVVVQVARRGPARQRQLAELAACPPSTSVEVRWPAVSWKDSLLFTAALLAGAHCPEFGPEDQQSCFEQYARALAPSGAAWDWVCV
ncbi:MAG: hypothetical protein JWM64_2839 [Frankiales bacterium]|nr:hypothetical protein [Frankiales bacterium]